MGEIQANVMDIREFVNIQAQYENSSAAALDRCKEFLNSGKFFMVRKGDVYGFMIEHYAKNNQYKPANALLEDMRSKIPNVNVAYYVNVQTIRAMEQALGTLNAAKAAGAQQHAGVASVVAEILQTAEPACAPPRQDPRTVLHVRLAAATSALDSFSGASRD